MWVIEKITDFSSKLIKELSSRGESFEIFDQNKYAGFERFSKYYCSLDAEKKLSGFNPDNYFMYSQAAVFCGLKNMVSNKYILLPYKTFMENYYYVFGLFAEECKVFIRPNSSKKLFTGRLFDLEEFNSEIKDFENIKSNDLLVISPPKKIIGEWRFLCFQDKLIDGSLYRFNHLLTEVNSWPKEAENLIIEIIKEAQFTNPFVVDVALMDNNEYKVIEFNHAKTANLYACNPGKFIDLF